MYGKALDLDCVVLMYVYSVFVIRPGLVFSERPVLWLQLQFPELQLQSDLAEMLTIAAAKPEFHSSANRDFAVTTQVLNRQTGKTDLQLQNELLFYTTRFQCFKVLLSFLPLGARKRSYIRTRHSL